jgi:hypothetical protein
VCLRFLAEQFQQAGKGSVKVERSEPKGNLDGFLARLQRSQKNEGTTTRFWRDAPFVGREARPERANPLAVA